MTDGVPFMITVAMRVALRRCGLADTDIENMTPEEAHRVLLTPDVRTVRSFFELFVTSAQKSLGDLSPPGWLQMTRKHPNASDFIPTRYRIDDVGLIERMTHEALIDSEAGHNVYVEPRFVKFGLGGKKRGELVDTGAVFALVVDSDADRNMGWTPPPNMRPTLTVETSPGNHQFWYFLNKAIGPAQAKELGARIRKATGSDHDTGTPTQPYRVPGTINYPNRVKLDRGRVATPTWVLAP
jgi:hypothetical protein